MISATAGIRKTQLRDRVHRLAVALTLVAKLKWRAPAHDLTNRQRARTCRIEDTQVLSAQIGPSTMTGSRTRRSTSQKRVAQAQIAILMRSRLCGIFSPVRFALASIRL